MAGAIFGDIAGAVVHFLHIVEQFVVDALHWIKDAIMKLYGALERGMRTAVSYEKTLAREAIRFFSAHDDLAFGLVFAVLFDVMGVNE
jgi:hypothetical protein